MDTNERIPREYVLEGPPDNGLSGVVGHSWSNEHMPILCRSELNSFKIGNIDGDDLGYDVLLQLQCGTLCHSITSKMLVACTASRALIVADLRVEDGVLISAKPRRWTHFLPDPATFIGLSGHNIIVCSNKFVRMYDHEIIQTMVIEFAGKLFCIVFNLFCLTKILKQARLYLYLKTLT